MLAAAERDEDGARDRLRPDCDSDVAGSASQKLVHLGIVEQFRAGNEHEIDVLLGREPGDVFTPASRW